MKNLVFLLILLPGMLHSQPPFSGTIFIDPDIITSSDPSTLESTTYKGMDYVTMYDRRVADWVTVEAFLFDVVWDDGLTSVAQVNAEFGNSSTAAIEAEKYGFLIGQLPKCLRVDVDEIWIHKGIELYGGGNRSILIHTGQSVLYENDGIIEETLMHEAAHTSLDGTHAIDQGWVSAQNTDPNFISTYARDNPQREDIAESFLTWFAVRIRKSAISTEDYLKITGTIPNRINYFDQMTCDLNPFERPDVVLSVKDREEQKLELYPNPAGNFLTIKGVSNIGEDVRIYNLSGQDLTGKISYAHQEINVSKLPRGYYLIKVGVHTAKFLKY